MFTSVSLHLVRFVADILAQMSVKQEPINSEDIAEGPEPDPTKKSTENRLSIKRQQNDKRTNDTLLCKCNFI